MRKRRWTIALAILLTAMLTSSGWGAKHALLMGAWKYPNLGLFPLQGPKNDVAVLKDLLEKKHGFDRVITLLDGQMTRKGILGAMKRLDGNTAPGDFILIYYSGHGTSAYDRQNKWGLSPHTGALLPNDFSRSGTMEQLMENAVIGTRDIRPILTELERKNRQILVLFDACYSGFAVRSMSRSNRYVPLPLEDLTGGERPGQYGADTIREPPYPYRNVIYISASSCQEEAYDVSYEMMLREGKKTVDGQPHGAMTDSLIRALQGSADTDRDGRITYNELYGYVRDTTAKNYNQTPQLLYAKSDAAMLDRPLFRTRSASPSDDSEKPDNGPLRVKLQSVNPSVEKAVKGIPGLVTVSEGGYDILVTGSPLEKRAVRRKLYLYLSGGSPLAQGSKEETLEILRRHVRVKGLIRHAYPDQSFNVSVDLVGSKGVLVKGDTLGFTVRSDVEAHILLVDIEPGGAVNVLYPYTAGNWPTKKEVSLANMCVVDGETYGTEHIKVIAFKDRPPALERLMGQEGFTPGSSTFSELMALVEKPGTEAAQMTIQVKTASRKDITWIEKE